MLGEAELYLWYCSGGVLLNLICACYAPAANFPVVGATEIS